MEKLTCPTKVRLEESEKCVKGYNVKWVWKRKRLNKCKNSTAKFQKELRSDGTKKKKKKLTDYNFYCLLTQEKNHYALKMCQTYWVG